MFVRSKGSIMESNDSDGYVAKLLEQLEELKKKKARRLKKLKNLTKVNGKDISTSTENVSALVSTSQSVQNKSLLKHIEEKENITDLKCQSSLFLSSSIHNCNQSEVKESVENASRVSNSSSSLNFESDSNKPCPNNSLPNSPVNNVPDIPFKKNLNNHSEHGSDLFEENDTYDKDLKQNIKDLSVPFSLNVESQQKIRKRSTSEVSETMENSNCENKKKFKLSEDVPTISDIPTEQVSENENILNQNVNVFSTKIEQPIANTNEKSATSSKTSDDCSEDSLSHNMTCFMSCNLFIGEEINDDIPSNVQQSVKCEDLKELVPNVEENSPNMVSIKNCLNSILPLPSTYEQKCLQTSESIENFNVPVVSNEYSSKTLKEAKCNADNSKVPSANLDSIIDSLEMTELPNSPVNADEISRVEISDNSESYNILPGSTKFECVVLSAKSEENFRVEEETQPPQYAVDKNSPIFSKSETPTLLNSQDPDNIWPENETQWEFVKNENEAKENLTPSLLDSTFSHFHQAELKNKCVDENIIKNEDQVVNVVTTVQTIDLSTEGLIDDALTADIDFNSSMSLEVSDTVDSLLNESSKEQIAASVSSHNGNLMQDQSGQFNTNTDCNTEICIPDTEIFTIPETEFFESSHSDEVDTVIENNTCIKPQNKSAFTNPVNSLQTSEQLTRNCTEKFNDGNFLYEQFSETLCGTLDQLHTVQETLLFEAEDTQDVENPKNVSVTEKFFMERHTSNGNKNTGEYSNNITLTHSFHSDVGEAVQNVKFIEFSCRSYIFIQHTTWIQIWHQEENKAWTKVFSHEVGDIFQLEDICCSADSDYLVLVMLLRSNEMCCLQFLLFEKERKVIKLMEHTHWFKNKSSSDSILLCGLEGLKFAVAQGNEDGFEIFMHVFNCLEENPRLLTAVLGSTVGRLKSLCSIEKLPNALMGTSESTLYVWHVLEARLVTSVNLQSSDESLFIEKCIWATIENGLVFFMAVCKNDSFRGCELLAANLATGFCQRVMVYSLRPAKDAAVFFEQNIKAFYNEPFLAVASTEGAFLWCVTNEYCCAALDKDADVTALAIYREDDTVSVIVGNSAGCANSYNINCS